jgi:16S rRNA (uracil1498-N3)-methyltransferase
MDASRKRVERWRKIARESSQQARRSRLPEISDPVRLTAFAPDGFRVRLWLDEESPRPFLDGVPAVRSPEDSVSILVGPEGGWTAPERERLLPVWTPVSLGPQILRTETAAIAALSLVMGLWHGARV